MQRNSGWLTSCRKTSDFQVKYWRKYDDTEPGANRIFVPATSNHTRLENMLPDSHYLIEVRAFNGAGVGPPSEHCEMFTRRPRKTSTAFPTFPTITKGTGSYFTLLLTGTGRYFTLLLQEQEVTLPCFLWEQEVTLPCFLQEQEVTLPCFCRNRKLLYSASYGNRKILYPASTGTGCYFTLLLQEQEVTLPCFLREQEVTLTFPTFGKKREQSSKFPVHIRKCTQRWSGYAISGPRCWEPIRMQEVTPPYNDCICLSVCVSSSSSTL